MKKLKTKELSDSDLDKKIKNKREDLRQIRFDVAGTKAKDVKQARNTRRDVARLLTEANKRRISNSHKLAK